MADEIDDTDSRRLDPVVLAYLDGIDRSLVRKNLALSVEERFLQLMALQRFSAELRRAASRDRDR
jgi:hypothetical protein